MAPLTRRRAVRRGAGLLLVAALVWSIGTRVAAQNAPQGVCNVKGKHADLSFTLKNLDGEDVHLGGYARQVILINFWATWCTPCKGEIPGLVALYNKYRSEGFVVLGISVDDTVQKLEPFVAEFKMNYPVLVGRGHGDLQDAYSPLVAIPTSFLVERDGTICVRHDGYTHVQDFEREIRAVLAMPDK